MESMRMATLVPNALPHIALEDIHVRGYVIPKVIMFIFSYSHFNYSMTNSYIFVIYLKREKKYLLPDCKHTSFQT